MNKLYISDLDGTLLNSRGILSPFSQKHITRLIRAGIPFTIASARNIVSIQKIFHSVPLKLPVISGGGAYISDCATGKHEYINGIPQNTAEAVFQTIREYGVYPFISSFNKEDHLNFLDVSFNDGMSWYFHDRIAVEDKRLRKILKPEQALKEKVITFIIIDKEEPIGELHGILEDSFGDALQMHIMENLYNKGWFWLSVHDRKSRKEIAAEILLSLLGYSREDLVVFGDNVNDIGLFWFAGTAVAVKNAEESVKSISSEITGTNDEDSVVRYIMKNEIPERK